MNVPENKNPRGTPFKRLGRAVFRRRRYVIISWVLGLVLVLPIIVNVGKVTSLQQGSATGNQLESVKAAGIISADFARTVPNSTLIIVISGNNVSTVASQKFIHDFVSTLKSDRSVVGLNQTVDVYSKLYTAINGVNHFSYLASSLANSTSQLLLGIPALYFGIWVQSYGVSHNITAADAVAYQNSTEVISPPCSPPGCPPRSNVEPQLTMLKLFNSSWSSSWSDPSKANFTAFQRAAFAARVADQGFAEASQQNARPLLLAIAHSFSISDFLPPRSGLNASQISSFAVRFVSNSTSYSVVFVQSTFSLGKNYSDVSLYNLAGAIVSHPRTFSLDPGLSSLVSSLVSPHRDTTLISLGLNRSSDQNLLEIRSDVRSATANAAQAAGISSVMVTGQDAISYDFGNSTQDDLGLILPVTIVLLIVATGLFFRSLLTPFITLGTIGVALGISQTFIVLVGTYIAKVDFTIPTVLLTVLIGVGTDYSVFVIARYREERIRGLSVEDAVEVSVTWAGESIATSGATVIISFLSLALTSIVFLRTMGIVVGLGVLVALSVALTLVPAVVGMVGSKTFWPNSGKRFEQYSASVKSKLEKKRGYFSRSGAFAVKRAKLLIVLAFVISGPALYVYSTTVPTYDFLSAAPSSLESVAASNHLTDAFGGGKLFPTYVLVTFDKPILISTSFDSAEMNTVDSISAYLASSPNVRNVSGPTRPFGEPVEYGTLSLSSSQDNRTLATIRQEIGMDGRTALITVNFGIDPYSTAAIGDAQAIRQHLHSSYDSSSDVRAIFVGGASGSILDTKNVFDSQFNSVVPIVAVGVALVLLVVLGSLFLPVFAVLSVLMSIVWTLAVTKFVFQAYFDYQILFITPFFLFVTLLGLGMDYNIFILTRIREEATKGKHLNQAIVGAIEQTGGIITAAAIILAGSLGALMLSSDLLLKQLGFAFAFSILIDALVVRTYLVPAVMATMGRWNWYSPIPYLNRSHSLFEEATREQIQA